VGYTRDVTVGVWVGNFDRRALIGSSGVTGAGPIFQAVMLAAQAHAGGHDHETVEIVPRPPDLSATEVCELSGMRAGTACPSRRREWLGRDASPLPCSWHHGSEEGLLTLWPDEYRHWAAARGLLQEERRPSFEPPDARLAATTRAARRGTRLDIVSPAHGAVYLLDPTLRRDFQALSLRASGGTGMVEWRVNGKTVGREAAHRPVSWPLRPGDHQVSVRDDRGRSASVAIRVK
jgi:penicillin-binding protein 1C